MRILKSALFLAAGHAVGWAVLGQTIVLPVEIRQNSTSVYNIQSKLGVPLSTTAGNPVGSDGRAPTSQQQADANLTINPPTPGQFQQFLPFASAPAPATPQNLDTNKTLADNAANIQLPRFPAVGTPTVILLSARVGAPYVSQQISFLFGSVIPVPETDEAGTLLPPAISKFNYWLPEPYTTNGHTNSGYYWSPHARSVFAIQAGPLDVTWRKADPFRTKPADYDAKPQNYFVQSGNYYPIYKVRYYVSGSAVKSPRKMYWTEAGFHATGKPVTVPEGRVGAIVFVYNKNFPQRVLEEYLAPGQSFISETNRLQETRTIWYDSTTKAILAYNHEGRAFMEVLGDNREDGRTRIHLGFEIVDVIKQANPADVTTELGEKLTAFADGRDDSELFPESLLSAFQSPFAFRHDIPKKARPDFYATAETHNINDYFLHWLEEGVAGLRWPLTFVRYRMVWPDAAAKYSHYIRPLVGSEEEAKLTSVNLGRDNLPQISYEDPTDRPRAKLTTSYDFYTYLQPAFPAHRTLLRYHTGDEIAFERVFSWLDLNLRSTNFVGTLATNLTAWNTNLNTFVWDSALTVPRVENGTAVVGARIAAPSSELGAAVGENYWAGFIRLTEGNAYDPNAYQNPLAVGFDEANKGAIIPVNANPANNKLEVWWFRRNHADVIKGFQPIYWPSVLSRYTISWPQSPREIVLASNDGSGPLTSLEAKGRIYYENTPSAIGYNPNEEHALMLGGQAYALRDDINIISGNNYSSEPYVLVEYTEADGRPAMSVFKVLREKPEAGILFDYIVEAGSVLQAPMPLPLLPFPVERNGSDVKNYNVEPLAEFGDLPINWTSSDGNSGQPYAHYQKFTYQDRKNNYWVYRGAHQGLPALEAGSYNTNSAAFESTASATAVAGLPFSYSVHVSRRPESIVLSGSLPPWLTINGLTVAGTPQIEDVGSSLVRLMVTDVGDDATNSFTLNLTVASGGSIVTQGTLALTSSNSFAGTNVTYVGRPPYLASSASGSNSFTMRFYYKSQEGFAWPGITPQPKADDIVPYLRARNSLEPAGDKSTHSLDIVYRPVWPANPPRLQLSDTLALPKNGLPAVRGQTSLQVLYQQSIAGDIRKANVSATLHDPTREKMSDITAFGLEKLPDGVRKDVYQGKTYFPNLPPHLAQRLFFDPARGSKGKLVFRGEFKDEMVGEKYLLLNVLRDSDLAAVLNLCPSGDENRTKWENAIRGLATEIETFQHNDKVPGTYIPYKTNKIEIGVLSEISDQEMAVDSYALSAGGPGQGFLSLIAGNGRAFTPPGEPVSVQIVRVTGPLHVGELKVLASANPLNELLTMQHSVDVAGKFEEFEYEWKIAPPVDGLPPAISADMTGWTDLIKGTNINRFTLGGAGIQVLVDNYLIVRYRAKNPDHPLEGKWSDWTRPQLAEGWIKRVLAGINPFNQRVTDLFNNTVNSDVSLLTQAGHRWEGDVALNLQNINNFGLIEIYETVLRRGKMLSIEAGINFGPANDALLLAAGYINDLYMMLGNEAWADAANPTIGIGTKDKTYGDIATALFAFKGQLPSLLEEELGLLRGRDDFLQPSVEVAPVYNRLFWNYTRGIDSGEIIYALNYNIQENPAAGSDGVINAADALRMYPQGHGDAYGHYLTSVKGYYSLLMDTDFDWVPRTEAVLILGQPVQVDYLDERKFAAASAALGRAGRQIFDLTWRRDYAAGKAGWSHFSETRTNTRRKIPSTRYWGLDHWAARTAQGNYLNWVTGNAILPAVDPDPSHEGIQKVDRTTVPELQELPSLVEDLQTAMDNAEAGLTPLGLPSTTIPFDLNPDILTGTDDNTHFEQIFGRAKIALNNALSAFDDAKNVTTIMRSEEDSLDEFRAEIASQELSYTNALIELYGTPYPDDVGPGKTYQQDYAGPDLLHYTYVDLPESTFGDVFSPKESQTFKVDVQQLPTNWVTTFYTNFNFFAKKTDPRYTNGGPYIEFNFGPHGFFDKPEAWSSRRRSPGQIQQAISEYIAAHTRLNKSLDDAQGDMDDYNKNLRVLEARLMLSQAELATNNALADIEQSMNNAQSTYDMVIKLSELILFGADMAKEVATIEIPDDLIFGLAAGGEVTSFAEGLVAFGFMLPNVLVKTADLLGFEVLQLFLNDRQKKMVQITKDISAKLLAQDQIEAITEFGISIGDIQDRLWEINDNYRALDDARRNLASLIAQGDRILQERQVFRQRSAAITQGFRTRDAAFRVFRNEKLERYKTLFDLAARYSFLAAQAYDYETGLLHTDQGKAFTSRIIHSRALGVVADGEPQFAGSNTGDPGLSSALAEMYADWLVLKGRLGFNNPNQDGTTVSLRTENYRILPAADSDLNWRDVLESGRKANLLDDSDIRRYCMQISRGEGLAVPGIVLEFNTVIADGLNLFGQSLAAGDHNFSPSSFATKLYALGVSLEGYIGMDHPGANTRAVDSAGGVSPSDPTVTFLDSEALAATPYIYLVPVGVDSLRSPPLGDVSTVRTWHVDDVTIPLPFNIGASEFSSKKLFQAGDTLSEPIFGIRKHPAFRPVSSSSVFDGIFGTLAPSPFTNRRLIGRSVWNSKWKLVIPGHTLLSNPNEGLDRFIQTVKDVRIHLITYSYSGN